MKEFSINITEAKTIPSISSIGVINNVALGSKGVITFKSSDGTVTTCLVEYQSDTGFDFDINIPFDDETMDLLYRAFWSMTGIVLGITDEQMLYTELGSSRFSVRYDLKPSLMNRIKRFLHLDWFYK